MVCIYVSIGLCCVKPTELESWGRGQCDCDLDRNTGYLSLQKPLQQVLWGQCAPTDHYRGQGKGCCCPGLLLVSPPVTSLPHSEPVPPGSKPLPVSPPWRGLRIPALPCPCMVFSSSIKQLHGRRHTSAPTHKSFPRLSSSLSHPANINSSFQIHRSCHLRGDACPGAHMRINHLLSLPGTTSVAAPIMQGAV